MENRFKCPYSYCSGEIMTSINMKTFEKIYMCDECKDVWESSNLTSDNSISYDAFCSKKKDEIKNFEHWKYIVK